MRGLLVMNNMMSFNGFLSMGMIGLRRNTGAMI